MGSSGLNTGAGTLAALSGQFADATISTSITGSQLTIDGTGVATDASLAASINAITANTTVNNATVVFSDDISANLALNLAQAGTSFGAPITVTGGNLAAQELLSVIGGGSIVAST